MDAKPTAAFRDPAPGEPAVPCSHCARRVPIGGMPECREVWCTDACHDAWMAADPKRREGWVSLSDLTIEQTAEMFRSIGLDLSIDGVPVKGRMPS